MCLIAIELENIINEYLPLLYNIPEINFSFKPSINKWSKKEIIGHLIDSAQNNIRRFIVAQYETEPQIVYDQEKWVNLTGYKDHSSEDVINLWYLLNKNICNILNNCTPEMLKKQSKLNDLYTIEWLAKDYNKHLLHHLHMVLEMEEVVYP
jgi:hypothetical protein